MYTDLRAYHQTQLDQLREALHGNSQRFYVKKNKISNLFRYEGRKKPFGLQIDLSHFNKLLFINEQDLTVEVQGLVTYEQVVDYTLPSGLAPLITPELKHITVGGAIVGIGIEANSFRYGFVHNGLIEADVLLSDGSIITCTKNNKYSDLLYGLANSYGTLGYVLRAKIKLRKVLPYMTLKTKRFYTTKSLLAALKLAANDSVNDSIESLVYSKKELYLTTVTQSVIPANLISIYGNTIFYRQISKPSTISLSTKEYLFRYDPEWFWNVPNSQLFRLFRSIAPKGVRNSGFYSKYGKQFAHYLTSSADAHGLEQLIQDWEVPWKYADSLLQFVLNTVDLCGLPLLVAPVKVPEEVTFYPMKKNQLYFNLGSYSFVKKRLDKSAFYNTKTIDAFCFRHEGIKMLYSSTFISEAQFNTIYNGKDYSMLKRKYDSMSLLPTLFEKVVLSH